MEASLQAVYHLFRTTDRMISEILSHLDDNALRHTVDGNGNSALRLYAHVCVLRHRIYNKISGASEAVPFEGSSGGFPSEGDAVPPRGEVDVAYRTISEKLYSCFDQLTLAQLQCAGLGKDDFPTEDKTLLGSIAFLGYHEAYTIGQMGFLGHAQGELPKVGHLG